MNSQKILLVAKGFPPDIGGIETYSHEVGLAYARAGNEVHALTSHIKRPLTETEVFKWFHSVKQSSQAAVALGMLGALVRLRLAGYVPDLIHATSWRVGGLARLVWPKAKLAITVHGKEVFSISDAMKKLASLALSRADRLVFVSNAIREKFAAAFPDLADRAVVAWNGTTKFTVSPDLPAREDTAILTVCRLVERKNIISGIKALALLRDRGVQFTYRIAGTGPESKALSRCVKELDLEGQVHLLGFASEEQLVEEYSRASLFLHPQIVADNGADIEGFGITIADAMQFAGVPIVGANGGPLDFVDHGKTGFLTDGHDIEALAKLIGNCLEQPAKLASIGAEAKAFAKTHLTWESHVRTIVEAASARSD